MVHTKTIFTIAIIFIIQAKGNEIVLHGQGKDGSYNEYRKSESTLPGGVSKTVVITRRMLGSPVSTLNMVSSSLGNIGKPSLSEFRLLNLQPSLTHPSSLNSQWNLSPQNEGNQWNSVAPWNQNQQPASTPQLNLPYQPSANPTSQWNVPYQPSGNPALGINLQPNNLAWNLLPQMNLLGLNSQNNNNAGSHLVSQPTGSLDSNNGIWNAQVHPTGSSQLYPFNGNSELNPSSQPALSTQWRSSPQNAENFNYNPILSIPSTSDTSNQQNLISQIDGNVNGNLYPTLNSQSPQGLNLNLLQNSLGGSTQQSPWVVTRSFNIGIPNYSPQGAVNLQQLLQSKQVSIPGMQQLLNQLPQGMPSSVQTSPWGGSGPSQSLEKRSTDEVEEDNAEGHWLKK